MTNVFGSFGEWEVQLRKEQNELKQLKLKTVRLRSKELNSFCTCDIWKKALHKQGFLFAWAESMGSNSVLDHCMILYIKAI